MKAARIHRYGPPEVIALEDIPTPEPAEGEVVVHVKAAGVGPWDAWIRGGNSVLPQPLPLTLGADISGTVRAVGAGVRGFAAGDEVFGVVNKRFTGGYAEFAAASAAMVALKPPRLGHREAAGAPVVAVTALQMLFDHGGLTAGQRVLIHGAGGAVGAYAVQLAKLEGAHVTGTDRGRGLDYVKSLGADAVIDATSVRFEDGIAPVDLVVDTVGGDLQTRSFAALKPGGVLVSAVSQPSADEAARRGVRATFMLVDVTTKALAHLGGLMQGGHFTARLGPWLPLSEARRAHEMLDGLVPREPGKIVLNVEG